MQINVKGNGKAGKSACHEYKENVKELVVVESNRVVDKGTVMVKEKDAFAGNFAVFGSQGSGHVACMTQLLLGGK
jgi:hypothetical protein